MGGTGGANFGQGGDGIVATGGLGTNNTIGNGGNGITANGGNGTGAGTDGLDGGAGISAVGGNGGNGTIQGGNGGHGIVAKGGARGAGGSVPSNGLAGLFIGDVSIQASATPSAPGSLNVAGSINCNGILSGGVKPFKIDHPLDPENKFLYHSSIESPDMMNVYNGEVVLDAKGEATVELPSYFEALNKDFRYQLTCVGGFAPVYIAERIHENRFKIAGGREGLAVSWLVTGIRQDAYANAHRIQPEVEKSPTEKGKFLHPVELGRPESCRIGAATVAATPARPEPAKGSKHD
jgi:hypothetical protein